MSAHRCFRYLVIMAAAVLLALHMLLAHFNVESAGGRTVGRGKGFQQIFTPGAYRLFSFGMDDFTSRMIVLYNLYNPANENIPSINFAALTAALRGATELDRDNIQPYLYTAHFWKMAKTPESRKYMVEYLLTGLDRFTGSWEIPYAIYWLTKDAGDANALFYLRIAAGRAAAHGGPEWLAEMYE